MLDEIGICITAHERPALCRQLIASIQRFYPGARIYVCDDSRTRHTYEGVTNVDPGAYDIGVSAKRNALVEACTEPLVLLCEEDFVFTAHTDLSLFYDALQALPEVGLAGAACCRGRSGSRWPKRGVKRTWFAGISRMTGPAQKLSPPGPLQQVRHGGRTIRYHECDFVPNFFLARRETLRACPWDPDLKTAGEHIEHMTRMAAVRELSAAGGSNAEQYRRRFRGETAERKDGQVEVYALATIRNKRHFADRQRCALRRGERALVPAAYAEGLEAAGRAVPGMKAGDAQPMPIAPTDAPMQVILLPDTTCAHDRQHSDTYQASRGRSHIQMQKDKMGIYHREWTRGHWTTYPHGEPDWDDPATHAHAEPSP